MNTNRLGASLTLLASLGLAGGCSPPGEDGAHSRALVVGGVLDPGCGLGCGPVLDLFLDDVVQIAAAGFRSYAVTATGDVYVWGGVDSTPSRPVRMAGLGTVVQVAVGFGLAATVPPMLDQHFGCAIRTDGRVSCWRSGELPELLDAFETAPAAQLSMGVLEEGCARLPLMPSGVGPIRGLIYCWDAGRLPRFVTSGQGHLAKGKRHTCTATTGGSVKCWGDNTQGQVGQGTTTASYPSPVTVPGLTGIARVFSGSFARSSFAVAGLGRVYGWGWNYSGELGDGSATMRLSPVVIPGYHGASSMSIGYGFSCAAMNTGAVRCTGHNGWGQLGDGTTLDRYSPGPVSGLGGVVQVAVGDQHACALTASGNVWCWGSNAQGQVGDGRVPVASGPERDRLVPVRVVSP